MSERNLSEIVNGINEQLRAHGKNAVQEVKMTDREGKTVNQRSKLTPLQRRKMTPRKPKKRSILPPLNLNLATR